MRLPHGGAAGSRLTLKPAPLSVTLALLGIIVATCLFGMEATGNLTLAPWRFVFLFAVATAAAGMASWLTFRYGGRQRSVLWVVCVGAILFRAILWPMAPSLSTDILRYVWDGKVQQVGINPYQFPPNAPELASLRDEAIFPGLNHSDWISVYPPGAQLLFRAMTWLTSGSVLAIKGIFILLDLASCGLIVLLLRRHGMDPGRVILYAWHPLVLVELAGSGHLESVVIPLILGALLLGLEGRVTAAGLLLGIGGALKLYPLLLLPAVVGRRPWRPLLAAASVMVASALPFLPGPVAPLGAVHRLMREEWFNPGIRLWIERGFEILGMDPGSTVRWALLVAMGLIGVAVWVRGPLSLVKRALWMLGAHLLLIPNLFSWYVVSIIPLLCLTPIWPWLWLSAAVALSYLFFAQIPWSVPVWVMAIEFVPLWAGLLMVGWQSRSWLPAFGAAPTGRTEA